jgi:ABC-2 family transporter protein
MTTSLTAEPPTPAVHRDRIGLRDSAWLAWRQSRATILVTGGLVAALCGGLVWADAQLPNAPCPEDSNCWVTAHRYESWAAPLLWLTLALPFFAAVFWGAPLVAREYEQRTHLLAWSQDVSERRWLLSRIVLLGSISSCLAIAVVLAATPLLHTVRVAGVGDGFNELWDTVPFEAAAPLAVAYTIAGLGVGLAVGTLIRRVVPAMGITLAAFAVMRVLLQRLRFSLLPPLHRLVPVEFYVGANASFSEVGPAADTPGPTDYILGGEWVDASGRPTELPRACVDGATGSQDSFFQCLRESGITHWREAYQPANRIDVLRLIETGIFVAVAVAAIAAVAYLVQRRRTIV